MDRRAWFGVAASTFILGTVATPAAAQFRSGAEKEVVTTFLNQEREVWQLEGLLMHEAMKAVSADGTASKSEIALRKQIRKGRSTATLRKVSDFINDYLQPDSRSLLKDIADSNSVSPEDVFADYLTVEATTDFSLMASAYKTANGSRIDQFPQDARRLLTSLVRGVSTPPAPSKEIEVGRIRDSQLSIKVFGLEIVEEITDVTVDRRSARVNWRSNYFFLRDLKDRVDPKETREETLVLDNDRWTISYQDELEQFLSSSGRTEWGRKVAELVNTDRYLDAKDPLDRDKSKRDRYVYDPDAADDRSTSSKYRYASGEEDSPRRDRDADRNSSRGRSSGGNSDRE